MPPPLIVLPDWPAGTAALLATGGGTPHVIPVSTAIRAGDDRVLLALAPNRASLARLRGAPRVALAVLAAGDVAVTLEGTARVLADPLPGAERVVAVELLVDRVHDHSSPRFRIDAGAAWAWTDDDAAAQDAAVRGALATLAAP